MKHSTVTGSCDDLDGSYRKLNCQARCAAPQEVPRDKTLCVGERKRERWRE